MPPSVSVVVPTFRRAGSIGPTLEALLRLDYPSELLEIIVVDDGSDDGTAEVLEQFPGVRSEHQRNAGVAVARNRGARVAHGDLLLFNDDDIVVAPDNLLR